MGEIYELNAQSMNDQSANAYSLDLSQMEDRMDTYTSLLNVYKEVLKFVDFGGLLYKLSGG